MRVALWPESAADGEAEIRTFFSDCCICGAPHGVFVAEMIASSRLVGFIEVSIHQSAPGRSTGPVGYVEGWFVDSAARRCGLGRQLLAAGEAWCRRHGSAVIASDTTGQYMKASVPAHLACGFRQVEHPEAASAGIVHFIKSIG